MDQHPELEGHRWQQRIVLLFADERSDDWQRQHEILEQNRGGLAERDLVCYQVIGETGEGPAGPLPAGVGRTLRKRFDAEGFTVVLIGKDGGEKERWHAPVAAETLFGIIDAMPMRRREMRND